MNDEFLHTQYEFASTLVRPHSVVFDFACRDGFGTHLLGNQPNSAKVIGVDSSYQSVHLARANYGSTKIEFQRKNLDDDKTLFHLQADFVVSVYTVSTLCNDRQFFRRLYACTKRDGYLFLSFPNSSHGVVAAFKNSYFFRYYSFVEMSNAIMSVGFRMTRYFVHLEGEAIREEISKLSNIFLCQR